MSKPRISRVIGIFVLTLWVTFSLFFIQVKSQTQVWDFSGEFQPSYEKIWEKEENIEIRLCGNGRLDDLFLAYTILHPQFSAHAENADLRKQWRMNLILDGIKVADPVNDCFYKMLSETWYAGVRGLAVGKTMFCGVPASDLTIEELSSAQALEELTFYGLSGSATALRFVLAGHPDFGGVKLNNDVHYLFQLVFDSLVEPSGSLRDMAEQYLVSSPEENLTFQRRQFVFSAFEQGDYQSVIDTTSPC